MTRRTAVLMVCAVAIAGNAYGQQMIGGCPVLPANNIWNTPIDTLPVLANSSTMVNTIGASRGFHADFGAGIWNGGPIGIPLIAVPGSQAKFPATFLYAGESDPGPYAVPLNAPIEGGSNSTGDRHILAVDADHCILYELYRAFPQSSSWTADSGVIVDLRSNALRPATWTSADAAGLPIAPGLVTYDEMQSGEIKHAIRFTVPQTRREYVWPARHYASSLTGTQYPRMGERFRLKASVNISAYPSDVQVILRAMKKYGIMLADNGSAWYLSGVPDPRWNDDHLQMFGQLLGSNFEAVDATLLRIDPNSGAAIQSGVSVTVYPSAVSVRVGHFQSFSATVTGAAAGVTWSVNDIVERRSRRRHDRRQRTVSAAVHGSQSTRRDRPGHQRRRADRQCHGVRHDSGRPEHHLDHTVGSQHGKLHPGRHGCGVRHRLGDYVRWQSAGDDVRIGHHADGHRERAGGQILRAGRRGNARRRRVEYGLRERHRGCSRGHRDLARERLGACPANETVRRDGQRCRKYVREMDGERHRWGEWNHRNDQPVGTVSGTKFGPGFHLRQRERHGGGRSGKDRDGIGDHLEKMKAAGTHRASGRTEWLLYTTPIFRREGVADFAHRNPMINVRMPGSA